MIFHHPLVSKELDITLFQSNQKQANTLGALILDMPLS